MDINLIIIGITCVVSFMAFQKRELMAKLIFNPFLVNSSKDYFRFISSGLIHGDYMHLGINMFVLWSFGSAVEYMFGGLFPDFGKTIYLLLYLSALVVSSIPTFLKHREHPHYSSLGASGAVSAVVFASILISPMSKIYLYGIIGAPGIVLGLIYLGYSIYADKKQSDNTNHSAHLTGAIYGFVFTAICKPSLLSNFVSQILEGVGL